MREEDDDRIDQPLQDETPSPEVKEMMEHVQEPVCEDTPMNTEVQNPMTEAPEESTDQEMPVLELNTAPAVEEEEEEDSEMMYTQEKPSVEVEEKQMEIVDETSVTRDSPESPQMEAHNAGKNRRLLYQFDSPA